MVGGAFAYIADLADSFRYIVVAILSQTSCSFVVYIYIYFFRKKAFN